VSQVRGDYEAHYPAMATYLAKVKEKSSMFEKFEIEHVPRSKNRQADALSKLASASPDGRPKIIHWEILPEQMIDAKELVWINRSETWIEPLMS